MTNTTFWATVAVIAPILLFALVPQETNLGEQGHEAERGPYLAFLWLRTSLALVLTVNLAWALGQLAAPQANPKWVDLVAVLIPMGSFGTLAISPVLQAWTGIPKKKPKKQQKRS